MLRVRFRPVLVCLTVILSGGLPLAKAATGPWATVPLGGGGYVTGLVSNSNGSAIYCRTDVGGAFRWSPAVDGVNGTWISLSDAMVPYGTTGAVGLMNVDGIGTDPNNLDQVYVGAGSSSNSGLRGIFSSSDQGLTWTQVNATIRMAGNGSSRACGERLAVDPNNSNMVWYGSVLDGLQKGVKNGGIWTWTQIPAASVPFGVANAGVTFVVCDRNGTSTIIYAGVNDATLGGVYQSTDSGTTWSKVTGAALLSPRRARISSNGTLYVTGGTAGIAKLVRGGTLEILPSPAASITYHGVAVDPNDPTGNTVYVAQSQSGSGNIWRSINGGTTWLAQGTTFNEGPINSSNHARKEPDGTPSMTGYWFGSTSSLFVNPANSNELWLGDFFGVARTRNAQAMGTNPGAWWHTLQKGQEETVTLDLKTAPSGPALMTGLADVGGFRYLDTTVRPTGAGGNSFRNTGGSNTTGLDFSEANPNVWARGWVASSGSTGSGAVSSDGGANWLKFGQIAARTVTNSATAGVETWDVSTYLAKQKAKGVNTVTLVVASSNAPDYSGNLLSFDSREAVDPSVRPKLVINGVTSLTPVADTHVWGGSLTTNYGNTTSLPLSYAYGITDRSRWAYLKFDLSGAVPITSASLQLHRRAVTNTTVFPVGVFACTNTTWVEGDGGTDNLPAGEMIWNNYPKALSNAGGGPHDGPNYYDGGTALSGGRVAVSSTDPDLMVWMSINAAPRYSNDRGVSWTASTGAPASQITGIYTNGGSIALSGQPLAADRGNGNFYIGSFGGASHVIYRSTNHGVSWTQVSTVGNGGSYNMRTPQLVTAPVSPACPTGGDVWLCDDGTYNNQGGGLWRSTNSAGSWATIAGIGKVTAVSFGKSSTGSGYSVFICGYKGGVPGIYRSDDYGVTWVKLPNPTIEGISALAGDRQNYGKVFLGTGGRGVFQAIEMVAPGITAHPQDQDAALGGTASLSVGASGTAPTYQWLFNGNPLPGRTAATLSLNNLTLAQAGNYSVAVTNPAGTVTSAAAWLTVQASYNQWAGIHFSPQQLGLPEISGRMATPQNDGLPNLLKYLFNINPAVPMTAADHAALPSASTETFYENDYLVLTYRRNAAATGVTVYLQASAGLESGSWETKMPDVTETLPTDALTGDCIVRLKMQVTDLSQRFVRLMVTSP
ncbi:MAG: immunoglobulin domain-containing protein [Verrucomicrobiota bacterium]